MGNDIVDRLRSHWNTIDGNARADILKAADEIEFLEKVHAVMVQVEENQAKKIERLRAENTTLRAQTEWRPITDEQRNGETVLVFVPSHGVSRMAWYCEETGLWPSDDEGPYTGDGEPCNVGYPTHYKPLGPLPEDAT